jgi:ABC-2 type transport system ATP-binding protein
MTDLAVDVHDLRMRYGDTDVLDGISLQVRTGEVLAVLGPNGAGKTTTIEILEGFRARSAGRVEVLGSDPAHGGERWRSRVGVVLQSWRDHANWRVRELLAYLGSYYGSYRRPWDPDELITAVGLTSRAHSRIKTLSGGQRRRLDVAIGIVGRPDLLFLDEPTTGFDPEARRDFHELVAGLDTTVVLTTHDLDEAQRLAGRILILSAGRIVADGTPAELTRRIAGRDEVRWILDGEQFAEATTAPAKVVHDLYALHGDAVTALEVRRSSLADAYLALVRT